MVFAHICTFKIHIMSTEFAKASAFRDFSALCSRVSGGVFSCSSACHYYCIYVSDPAGVLLTFVFPPKTEFQISVVNDWFHFYRPIPWFHLRVLWSHGAGGDARSVLSHWWCALLLVCPGEVWLPNQWCEPHDVNIYQKNTTIALFWHQLVRMNQPTREQRKYFSPSYKIAF